MINSRSKSKDLSVYDFSAEELEVESFSDTYNAKLKAKLELKENKVDDPEYELMQNYNNTPEASFIDSPGKKVTTEKFMFNENMASSTSYGDPIAKPVFDIQSDGTPVDVISKDEESSTPGSVSLSAGASDIAHHEDYMDHRFADTCFTMHGEEEETDGMPIIISPDYIIYEHTLYGEAHLVFTPDSIIIRGSDTSGDIVVECAVADILYIESQWSESVKATLVKFQFGANTSNKVHETHDLMELIFSVTDTSWLDNEPKIKYLSERYTAAWNTPHHDDYELEEACMVRRNFFPRYYFTEIPCSFEDVVYPKGDPDAVSISRRDFELLEPDTFVNDTIIDFYIKYLKTKIPVNERHRYHFFNSFFFRKLADLDKDPGSASEGRAAFLRVRKWTRKVNIFEKDYIFIPVNFTLHWSLLIICHPGQVGILKDDEVNDAAKVPCILHMDSIKGSHSGLKDIIQSYLWEEWKERHPEATEDYNFKFSNLRFVSLELPQQENTFDCGLFLLHYVEMFLEEAPLNFNPLKISKSSDFLTADWFIPSEASFKRCRIRKLIYNLLNDNLQNATSESRFDDANIEKTPNSECYKEHCTQSKTDHIISTSSIMVSGIEMNIETSSNTCIKFDKRVELSMHEVTEPGTNLACTIKEDVPAQILTFSTEIFNNVELEQHKTSNPDQASDENAKSLTFLTAKNDKDIEEVDIHMDSRQEKEEVDLVILPKACDSPTVPKENNENQNFISKEYSNYVHDTPISSSGENNDEDQPPTTADGGEDAKREQMEARPVTDGIEHEKCNQTLDENVARINENDDGNKEEENICEGSPEIEFIAEAKGENVVDSQQTDMNNVSSGDLKDVVDVDEKSVSDDGSRKKRDGSNTKNGAHSRKKRKVSQPEVARRLTRSSFKGRNSKK